MGVINSLQVDNVLVILKIGFHWGSVTSSLVAGEKKNASEWVKDAC